MQSKDLDDLDLELDIGSSEGLSVDQMTRSRLQFLLGQNAYIIGQMQFADAKAGTLLAIVGVLAIIVAERQTETNVWFFAAFILIAVCVVAICLMALLPRVPKKNHAIDLRKTDLFSWPALSSHGLEATDFAATMRTSNASLLVMSIATSNVSLARILRRKYGLLRSALVLALVNLVVLGLTLLPSLI
ncbi:MAG: Pycsar system effector family protein [Pseudomonadota bacterium]